jgi:hypothetical protein
VTNTNIEHRGIIYETLSTVPFNYKSGLDSRNNGKISFKANNRIGNTGILKINTFVNIARQKLVS